MNEKVIRYVKTGMIGPCIPLADPTPLLLRSTLVGKPEKVKKLICKSNNKLLKSYGIEKGQTVIVTFDKLHLVKFYDKDLKMNMHVSLPSRLMKHFKEV